MNQTSQYYKYILVFKLPQEHINEGENW